MKLLFMILHLSMMIASSLALRLQIQNSTANLGLSSGFYLRACSTSGTTAKLGRNESKERRQSHAIADCLTPSESGGHRSAHPMCVCRVWWTEVSAASGSHEPLARHGLSGGRGASLPVLEVPAHLWGLSAGDDVSPDVPTRQRVGRHAVSAGLKLWSHLLSLRRPGRVPV